MRRKRKKILPLLILTIIFWGVWFYILLYLPPDSFLKIAGFILTLSLSLFFTFGLILGKRRGFLISLGVISYLLLRLAHLANLLNILLLLSLLITVDYYFRRVE